MATEGLQLSGLPRDPLVLVLSEASRRVASGDLACVCSSWAGLLPDFASSYTVHADSLLTTAELLQKLEPLWKLRCLNLKRMALTSVDDSFLIGLSQRFPALETLVMSRRVAATSHITAVGVAALFAKCKGLRVVELRLTNLDVEGFPDPLTSLPRLESFSIRSLDDVGGCTSLQCTRSASGAATDLKLVLPPRLPQQLLDPTSGFSHLQTLSLTGALRFPECFWRLPSLRSLELRNCGFSPHEDVGSRISELPGLTHLSLHYVWPFPDLRACQQLESLAVHGVCELPAGVRQLRNLRELSLGLPFHEDSPASLPEFLGDFPKLRRLSIQGDGLHSLPDSLTCLGELTSLELRCMGLKSLPKDMGSLSKLASLKLSVGAQELPATMCGLSSLEHLALERCCNLTALPPDLGALQGLQSLRLCSLGKLGPLPPSLMHHPSLKVEVS